LQRQSGRSGPSQNDEILKVQPVFRAVADSSKRLMDGHSAAVFRFIDGLTYLEAFTPTTPEADSVLKNTFPMPVANFRSRSGMY